MSWCNDPKGLTCAQTHIIDGYVETGDKDLKQPIFGINPVD